jgi:hypothetical protein
MRHGGDALALHQLEQQLVGAQVERDDARGLGRRLRMGRAWTGSNRKS